LRTANECPAWFYASDDCIISQATYAAGSLNLYARDYNIPINIVQRLNQTFMGYAIFELNNNYLTKSNLLD
jgi:hypothetical protein